MNSDYLRHMNVVSRGNLSVVAAGETFNTYYIDTADIVGPVVFVASASDGNASLSYKLHLEHATALPATSTGNGTGNATVTASDILGDQTLSSDNKLEHAADANNAYAAALSYNGNRRYVRAVFEVANASSATQNVAVSVVGIAQPSVQDPDR